MIDGIAGDAFSATTLPPIKLEDAGNEVKIIQSSRERYSSSRDEVEEKIRRWSGMLTPEERQAIIDDQKNIEQKMQKKASSEVASVHHADQRVKERIPQKEHLPQKPLVNVEEKKGQEKNDEPVFFEPALAPKRDDVFYTSPQDSVQENKKETIESDSDVVSSVRPNTSEKKVLYPTQCVSCGVDISVPFVPDGKRPTFCRDCLRDYQRSVAKERNAFVRNNADQRKVSMNAPVQKKKNTDIKAYVSSDAPLSLAQIEYIQSKKFRSLEKKPAVNLSDVRTLIKDMKKKDEK